jgi:hypothetical protein
MIRGAVIHMTGDQPLLADLPALPTASDQVLVCTNVRLSNGTRPTFIDRIENWFLIPLLHIRFVEIPLAEAAAAGMVGAVAPLLEAGQGPVSGADEPSAAEHDNELDADLLRRICDT